MLKKMQREGEGMNLKFVRMWHDDDNKIRFCGNDNGTRFQGDCEI
jgi:hypothetical protein